MELGDKLGPFGSEDVCASEGAISTTYNERIDAFLNQVVRSC
jgi:hypothetical protein